MICRCTRSCCRDLVDSETIVCPMSVPLLGLGVAVPLYNISLF